MMLDFENVRKAIPIKTVGIYKIGRRETDQWYIGSSVDMRTRILTHFRMLQLGNHYAKKLQAAWNKYQPFDFEILELCTRPRLQEREQYYLDSLSGYIKGFNSAPSVDLAGIATKEVRAGRSERAKQQHAEGRLGRSTWTKKSEHKFSINMSKATKGLKKLSPEHLEILREGQKRYWEDLKSHEAQAERARILTNDPDFKKLHAKAQKKYWTKEKRKEQSERARKQGLGKGRLNGRFSKKDDMP